MRSLFFLICLVSSVPTAIAYQGDRFGFSLSGVGDLNGDGLCDFAVGDPFPPQQPGNLWILSGKDGAVISHRRGPAGLGYSVSGAGDVNGDGVPDVLVGCACISSPRALVLSGEDLEVIHELTGGELLPRGPRWALEHRVGFLGTEVFPLDDVDGDDRPDFIAGAAVYSGRTGAVLKNLSGDHPKPLDDVDRDGKVDFLSLVEGVELRSGATGELIYSIQRKPTLSPHARLAVPLGDVDADGIHDVLIGYDLSAAVHSGATGALLHDLGRGCEMFGWFGSASPDLDGDDIPDFILSEHGFGCPSKSKQNPVRNVAIVYSGKTCEKLYEVAAVSIQTMRFALAGLGDVDGDGAADFLIGETRLLDAGDDTGAVQVVSGRKGKVLYSVTRAKVEAGESR